MICRNCGHAIGSVPGLDGVRVFLHIESDGSTWRDCWKCDCDMPEPIGYREPKVSEVLS